MAATEQGLRDYLEISPEDTVNLSLYLEAARAKAKAAGVPEFTDNAQYDMMLYSLAAMYYDNRGMAFSGAYQATAENNARKLINSFVLELRYAGEG